MANARKVAQNALLRVDTDGGYSNIVLNTILSAAQLDARDAALASALFYGVLERRITLDYIISKNSKTALSKLSPGVLEALRLGVYQLLFMDKIPQSAAVDQSVRLVKNSKESKASGFVNAVLRAVTRDKNALCFDALDEITKMSLEYSAPVWLCEMLNKNYGEHASEILKASLGRPQLNIRVNTLKTSVAELCDILSRCGIECIQSDVCPDYIEIKNSGAIDTLDAYKDGLFHVQDTASGLCCAALSPQKGERVLDLCAAPGGKSFTMAQMMHNSGEIVACDLYAQKAGLIISGYERLGLSIIKAKVNDAAKENPDLGTFDKILCDLPCSGIGIIRRKPEIRYKNVAFLDIFPDLQYGILYANKNRLKKGGILVYSTCTLNPAENEGVARRFLENNPDFEPFDILPELIHITGAGNMVTLLGHIHKTDGFFIAAFRKKL